MHYVYVIEAEGSTEKYIGYTQNLDLRLFEHNRHNNRSTSHINKWNLIYYESYLNKMDALGREKFLKSGSGWRFLRKQISHYLKESPAQNYLT